MTPEQLKHYFIHEIKRGWSYSSAVFYEFICAASAAAKGGVILDAGSGHQPYKPFFEDAIYIAQDHPVAGLQNKKILKYDILCDVRFIPLKDNSVDVILSTSSLEHMEFPGAFFSESFRVLKPGGKLFISAPFAYPEHEVPYDFQRLTRYGMLREYNQAGFTDISVKPTSSSLYSGQYFFLSAIKEDGRRMGRHFGAKIIWKPLYFLGTAFCKLTMLVMERGPKEDTLLPIGWIAVGTKPGPKEPSRSYTSKDDFIQQCAQCDDTLVIRDGSIVPK
jgi:SAM-dependent methyltransferase